MNDYISHIGRSKQDGAPVGSGRYPLGSGKDPYQHVDKKELRNAKRELKGLAYATYDQAKWTDAFYRENQRATKKYNRLNKKDPNSDKTRYQKERMDLSKKYYDAYKSINEIQTELYSNAYKKYAKKYGSENIKSLNPKVTKSGAQYLANSIGYKAGAFNNGNAVYDVTRINTYKDGKKHPGYSPTKTQYYYYYY